MKIAKKVFFIVLMILTIGATSVIAITGTINYDSIVVREDATTSSDPVAEGYEGDEVEIIDEEDGWYKVEYKGETGYIRADLLDVKEEESEEPEKSEEQEEPRNSEEIQEEPEQKEEEPKEEEKPAQEPNKETKQDNTLGEKVIDIDLEGRIVPSLTSSKLSKIKAGTTVNVTKVINGWSCVKIGSNKGVWVPSKFLKGAEETSTDENKPVDTNEPNETNEPENTSENWTGYINVSEAIIREGPSTESEIVSQVSRNTAIEIIGEDGDWYRILFEGEEAYIAKRLISESVTPEDASRNQVNRNNEDNQEETIEETDSELTSIYEPEEVVASEDNEPTYEEPEQVYVEEPVSAPAVPSSRGEEVVAKAKEYLGYEYVYGGSGPYSFDCSGFTMYIYGMFGVEMGHGATMQSSEGTYVSRDNLQPGDLLIFRDWDNESIGHCGIYIGNGDFIHAANPSRGVVIDTIYSGYYDERYVSGRRVL